MSEHRPQLEIVCDGPATAARAAALVSRQLAPGRSPVLGLATGGTMVPVYAALAEAAMSRGLSFRDATSFNLDEYVGVAPSAPASFHAYMRQHLLAHVDLAPERAHIPDGMAPDLAAEASRYEVAIGQAGGIDLQVLGIGSNGHIGFNEPGSDFASRTRVVPLSERTLQDNASDFAGEPVPQQALTMGIGTILEAREILLIAVGARKAEAIAAALDGPISTACPASALRLHPRVHIICDEAAASKLAGPGAAIRRRA